MQIHYVVLTAILCVFGMSSGSVYQLVEAAPAAVQADVDRAVVQRFDPFENKLIAVPSNEIKPGFLYNRYSERMGRRVWSIAAPKGGFEYAMAPGSTQPAKLLDLRATDQQMRDTLLERAPGLAHAIDVRGGTAFVRLLPDNTWEVVQQPTIASVFDLETSRRWEWHGVRRVAVMHTLGYEWSLVDGKFVPGVRSLYGVASSSCW